MYFSVSTKIEKPVRKQKPIAEKEPNKLMKKEEKTEPKEQETPVQPPPPVPALAPDASKYIVMDDMGNQSLVDFGTEKVKLYNCMRTIPSHSCPLSL